MSRRAGWHIIAQIVTSGGVKKTTTVSERVQGEILAWIDHFLGAGAPKRLFLADAPRQGRGGTKEGEQAWRVVLVGQGLWRVRYPDASGVRTAELTTEDALLLPPGTWFLQDGGPTRTKLYLFFTERNTYAHFSWHRKDAAAHRLVWENTMSPLRAAGWHVLRALVELPPEAPAALALLRALLLEARARFVAPVEDATAGKSARVYATICRYLDGNFHLQVSRETVARQFRLHPNHVSRLFRTQGGERFQAHLERLRMGRAEQLARRRVFTVDELAEACGYANTANFRKAFRRHHGVPPGRFA